MAGSRTAEIWPSLFISLKSEVALGNGGWNMNQWNAYDREKERLVEPVHDELQYCGRIDDENPDAPVFTMPASFVRMAFTGSSYVKAVVVNKRYYHRSFLGVLLDDTQSRLEIERDGEPVVLTLAENLDKGSEHMATLFKRMDHCHEYAFLGFLLEYGARVVKMRPLPRKKIEFYGDSVTAGEVSEAISCCGKEDPEHEGEYSNAYFSYAWATARRLHARVHIVAQGGIALLDGTGYFMDGKTGMESCYRKVQFYREQGERKDWDFNRYTPHVVVVAIGQNDAWPEDIMQDGQSAKAEEWRQRYRQWILALRELYPKAWIVLSTTVLYHNAGWDRSIGKVCAELNDPKIVHFLYSENGRGTPGHIRVQEAMNMALELSGFISGLGNDVWEP